ncbi:helix-turn-helix domain-containing protein [Couchioplanes caeruleus]|uniref:HTH cro/C1-type domain-containing protein n=2 Tax=Couchioplanes caeruleus TaxID=56438 RepID=A0A1K0FE38_9ACTN|nr:helix-turn-helix transcriptional regulator [Couchioplanes caeruleus]OJF11109.1 hypothetical protein BG844_28645 [Couchioplanes caeruleus subsp. caeruleus]ROP33746.1 helix-turn-helix protein [Couchioplanes caeruleus]
MSPSPGLGEEDIEVLPVVVVSQTFRARPSALPDIRDLFRRQLTASPVSDEDVRTLCDRVADVLLEVAGTNGAIQISLRIFPTSAEVDVLMALDREPVPGRGTTPALRPGDPTGVGTDPVPDRGAPIAQSRPESKPPLAMPAPKRAEGSFATWLSARLRAEGMSMEMAARALQVSTKTISRWVSGTTEPRLRDLYRIRHVFGEPPLH